MVESMEYLGHDLILCTGIARSAREKRTHKLLIIGARSGFRRISSRLGSDCRWMMPRTNWVEPWADQFLNCAPSVSVKRAQYLAMGNCQSDAAFGLVRSNEEAGQLGPSLVTRSYSMSN